MFRHVPNLLTGLRLVLALVFFIMLAYYQYEGRGDPWLLNAAFLTYLIALITDFLDGFLARRWHVEGQFGRVVDPFADKVLVLGSFIFFAGKNFIIPETATRAPSMVVMTLTGIAPGIVVILTAVSAFAGLSFGSVKPKSTAAKVYCVSSNVVTVLLVPAGASFTAVTLTVIVFAEASRSTPPFAVPPSSCTWKVKLV